MLKAWEIIEHPAIPVPSSLVFPCLATPRSSPLPLSLPPSSIPFFNVSHPRPFANPGLSPRMGKIRDLIFAALKCTDVMREEGLGRNGLTFAVFASWVNSKLSVCTTDTSTVDVVSDPALHDFLTVVVSPNLYTCYSKEQIADKIRMQSHAQSFRIVQGCIVRGLHPDRRVRDVVEDVLQRVPSFSPYELLCSFFSSTSTSGRTQAKKRFDRFNTKLATRFEQLLFVSAVMSLHDIRQSDMAKNKRRKLSQTSYFSRREIPGNKRDVRSVSQRIGWALQQVSTAWDTFAQQIGFSGVEEMVLPYICMRRPNYFFQVLLRREHGFSRKSQGSSIDFEVSPTFVAEETFPNVMNRSESCDQSLRVLAGLFLGDVFSITHATELFGLSGNTSWSALARFCPTQGALGLAPRFKGIMPVSDVKELIPDKNLIGTSGGQRARPLHSFCPSPSVSGDDIFEKQEVGDAYIAPLQKEELEPALDGLYAEMKPFFRMYHCRFDELCDTDMAVAEGNAVSGNVQLVLSDPPYNTRRSRSRKNSCYDVLTPEDMLEVVTTTDELLRPGGHVLIFCTAQQFVVWHRLFTEFENDENRPTFSVDSAPLVLTKHPSASNRYSGRISCSLHCCVELMLHAKKNGLPFVKEVDMVNYQTFNYVSSSFKGFQNVVNNVKGLLPGEQVRVPQASGKGTVALRAEQKPVALLKELISRFSNPGDFVVDLFAGTFSTAHACLELPFSRSFVGCEQDLNCFELARAHTIRKVAFYALNNTSDWSVSRRGMIHAKGIKSTVRAAISDDPEWKAPQGMPQYQQLPVHILGHLGSANKDEQVAVRCLYTPVHKWPSLYRGMLEQADVETLLAVESAVSGVMVSTSTIRHPRAGRGVFAVRTIHPNEVICLYYGTLVFHNLENRKAVTKTYADGILEVTVQRFMEYGVHVTTTGGQIASMPDSQNEGASICIVAAPFCVGGLINDGRYIEGDEEFEDWKSGALPRPRQCNCALKSNAYGINHPSKWLPADVIIVQATHVISPGEELFMSYNRENLFQKSQD